MKAIIGGIVGFIGAPVALFERFIEYKGPKRWPTDYTPTEQGDFWHYSKNVWASLMDADPKFWYSLLATMAILGWVL